MASSKMETTSSATAGRPLSAQKPHSTTGPVNVPARNGTPRSHSHSFSLGALNGGHRVVRRKSMSNNFSGVAAVVQGMDDASLEALVTPEGHTAIHDAASLAHVGSTPTVKPSTSPYVTNAAQGSSASSAAASAEVKSQKSKPGPKGNKIRRASEGAFLSKSDKKRSSSDIRCETCGKGYKHSSCLTKHLWEHTPQWQVTSKLLISKHQQVQMLEAASVLVTMNTEPVSSSVEMIKVFDDSDRSSASPMPSGSSAVQEEELSSVETTPPPMIEEEEEEEEEDDDDNEMEYAAEGQAIRPKNTHRYSSATSVFSQSFQSAPSMAGSIPTSTSYNSYHHFGQSGRRPSTSGTAYSVLPTEDEAKLAAAVENVSFGTPKTSATNVEGEIPPVPPLPPQYALQKVSLSGNALPTFGLEFAISGPTQRISDERGGRLANEDVSTRRSVSRGHHEEQDGVFSMEY